MLFKILPARSPVPAPSTKQLAAYLVRDNWDDYSFVTMFELHVAVDGRMRSIGSVKIGQFGIQPGTVDGVFHVGRPALEPQFEALDERFFSLGQGEDYYAQLGALPDGTRDVVLVALRDVALDLEIFDRAQNEESMRTSLLRTVTAQTVRSRLNRLAAGNAELTAYQLSYELPAPKGYGSDGPTRLSFGVEPDSNPPSNVHVLIGRNGVGKTTCLGGMAKALVAGQTNGAFRFADNGTGSFANLVSVAFSAFDPFDPPGPNGATQKSFPYVYIGLQTSDRGASGHRPKSASELTAEFAASARRCRAGGKLARWRRALNTLMSDPLFAEARVASLCAEEEPRDVDADARVVYSPLSSGHKIVLLTVTRLVETVDERTLVLVDEPEAHLHPPLLSALIRAISDLVVHRNAMAVVATHSPVVLQEVPRSCTWVLQRFGREVTTQRPTLETFGENVGILTSEVFGLEVTRAGFHQLIEKAVRELGSYDAVLERFDGQLGAEARAIVRALLAAAGEN